MATATRSKNDKRGNGKKRSQSSGCGCGKPFIDAQEFFYSSLMCYTPLLPELANITVCHITARGVKTGQVRMHSTRRRHCEVCKECYERWLEANMSAGKTIAQCPGLRCKKMLDIRYGPAKCNADGTLDRPPGRPIKDIPDEESDVSGFCSDCESYQWSED